MVDDAFEMPLLSSPADTATQRVAQCEPGAERACRDYHWEGSRVFCNESRQFCRADGFGWLACGAPAETPLPPAPAPSHLDGGVERSPR